MKNKVRQKDTKYDDMLYSIAMQCAKFNDEGCNCDCASCQFNVFNYVQDVREAALLKATAYTDYHNQQELYIRAKQTETAATLGPLLVVVLIIGGMVYCCSAVKSCFALESAHLYDAPQYVINADHGFYEFNPEQIIEMMWLLDAHSNEIKNGTFALKLMRKGKPEENLLKYTLSNEEVGAY